MIHVGVDLHQRFCYMTAMEARGKIVQAGAVSNDKLALRKFFVGLWGRKYRWRSRRAGSGRRFERWWNRR